MNSKKLKVLLILLFALLFFVLGLFYKAKCNNDAKRYYKQGMELYKQQKYSDAYYNFKQIKSFANMYQLSLLKQFQCADNLADKKTAHLKLIELSKLTKDKNLRPYILYNEALLSKELSSASDKQLYKKFKYIHETYPQNDYAIASGYKMAKLIENEDRNTAKNKYIEYLSYAPNGKFSADALKSVKEIKVYLTKQDYETIAEAYLANQNYRGALSAYHNTSFAKNWGNIAKCYRGLGDTESEKATILRGLNLKTSSIEEKELDNSINRLLAITNTGKIEGLQSLYTKYQDSYIFPTVAYKLAESSSSIRSTKLYELVANSYPNSIWASNSLWEVFWYNYKLERYKVCEEIAKKHISLYPNTQDAPRVGYWYGKVLLKQKKNQHAREAFYDVINNYPLSYYSFLSARALKISKAKKMIVKKPILHYEIDTINKTLFKDKFLLTLAEKNDFETIDELKINDEFIKSWVLHKKGIYPQSITTARDELNKAMKKTQDDNEGELKINFSNPMLKLVYPIVYEDEINKFACDFKQSPYLFLSLVREESHFDKSARSPVGAIGLAQIMLPTANFIEKTSVSKETLLDENENIRIGLKYFSYLVDFFNKNEYLAILSYNAGPGNINKWLASPSINSNEIDAFVENIPFLETKNYIKKILSSYWVYLNIYSPRNK